MRHALLRFVAAVAILLAPALLDIAMLQAQDANAEGTDRAKILSGQLSSPFCPGKTLDGCTSPAAAEWRKDIRTWVDEGVTSEEIKRRLSDRAGGQDLIAAPSSGFSSLWLVFSIVGSVMVLGFASRKLFTRGGETASAGGPGGEEIEEKIDEKYDQRLDDELALLD